MLVVGIQGDGTDLVSAVLGKVDGALDVLAEGVGCLEFITFQDINENRDAHLGLRLHQGRQFRGQPLEETIRRQIGTHSVGEVHYLGPQL